MGKLDRNLEAFLASQPARRSFEKEGLGGREGHGIFAYFLERGLQQGQADADRNKIVTVPELYAYLREEVRRATNRKQEPLHFGNLDRPAALADLRKAPSREPIAASLGKHLILLASAGGLSPGALAAPASPRPSPAPQADPRHTRFRTALEDEKLLGSDGAVELFRGLRTALPPETAHTEQINLAAALESQGQQIFLRYGIGDQFPDDPLRPRKSDFDEAAELFRLAQELRPEDLSAELEIEVRDSLEARKLFCRGRSLIFDPGRSGEAVSLLQRAVRASDRFAEPYNALGIARLEQADYTNAINAFQDALAQAPDWAYARHNLALTYIESGDYQAAEREYREAILRVPYHPYLYYNLGLLLQRLNRNRDAEREYRRSLETFDEQAAKYHSRALRWARADKEEESRLAFLRERILRKNQAEVHNALGSLWQGRGKNDRAERHYLVAVKRNPDLLPARYNLGLLYMHLASKKNGLGKLDDAIRLWEKTLEKDAGYVPSRLKLAEAYRVQQRFADADEQYHEVLRLRPQYRPARWALDENQADHLYAQGETAEACRKYRSVLAGTEHPAGPTLERQLRRKLKQRCK